MSAGRGAAFFDVDETIVSMKTMFSFLEYYLTIENTDLGDFDTVNEQLVQLGRAVPRETVNRQYYRLYAGHSWNRLHEVGQRWARATLHPSVWITQTADALREHRAAGRPIVLVSGSFTPCLDPIVDHVGAADVLCSTPNVVDDILTGGLRGAPMIGPAKAAAVLAYMQAHDIDPRSSYAYGDHPSDEPMLATVAHRTMIAA